MRLINGLDDFLEITLAILFFFGFLVKIARKKGEDSRKSGAPVRRGPEKADGGPVPAASKPAAPAEPSMSAPREAASPMETPYIGSLGVGSMEGLDPCHSDPQPAWTETRSGEEAPEPPSFQPAGWTGSDIVRGFVFSEILRRKKVS